MAKISELPQLANPAGTELVPVVGADGATKAARIGGLVDGAVARLVVAIGIEPVRAGWQEVVVDSNNRVVSGYHPVLSNYDGGRSALERRILVLEGGGEGVETIARKGGWITCTVDVNGRVVRGLQLRESLVDVERAAEGCGRVELSIPQSGQPAQQQVDLDLSALGGRHGEAV